MFSSKCEIDVYIVSIDNILSSLVSCFLVKLVSN